MRKVLAIGCWLLALGGSAQTGVWRSDSLQEVVVTGTGTQHLLKDAPVQTEVISQKMLQQYGGKSLEDILDKQRFVRISRYEIVNLEKILKYDFTVAGTLRIELTGGMETWASRRCIPAIRRRLTGKGWV